jgi:hypothetical protein
MKFWNNPFEEKVVKLCICGIDNSTIKAMPELTSRKIPFTMFGVLAVILATAVLGLADPRTWLVYLAEMVILSPMAIGTFRNIKKGHKIKCAIRKAAYTTF